MCKLTCESNDEFASDGACRLCKCKYDNKPVCSTLNNTFPDMCRLNCAEQQFAYEGKCNQQCFCPEIY